MIESLKPSIKYTKNHSMISFKACKMILASTNKLKHVPVPQMDTSKK